MISCLKQAIKVFETSKEGSGKQILSQRYETNELSAKLKIKIDLGNKLKVLSKERQNEITRLKESRVLSETIAEEKERIISCLKVNNKELETSKEVFNKQLLHQRDDATELYVTLKTEINSGNKLNILELVNTTFQHKNKHEDASVYDNTTHTIVENSNASEGNVTMITNNDKGGKHNSSKW